MPKQTFLLELPVTKRSEALLRMIAKASVAFSLRRDINMLGLIRGAQISYASVRATVIIKQRDFVRWGACARSRAIVIVLPDRMRDRLQAILHSYPSMNSLGIVLHFSLYDVLPGGDEYQFSC